MTNRQITRKFDDAIFILPVNLTMKPRIVQQLLPAATQRKLVLITGARQTGKTTLVKKQYEALRYINLDAIENREKLSDIASDTWGRSVGEAIIDEAQKLPIVFEKIKYAYDEQQLDFSVLLGSSQILLLKQIRESLAGRITMFELYPLMLCEIIASNEQPLSVPLFATLLQGQSLNSILAEVPAILFQEETIYRQAEEFLFHRGGMPALLNLTEQESVDWLRDYEQTYLERDLADLARLQDLAPFRLFQKLTAARAAQMLSYSELGRDAAVSADTARRYLEYLKLSYQVILLQPYHKNITSSLVKMPKLYWLDLGILRSVGNQFGPMTGALFENYVIAECYKWIHSTRDRAELYFYRTKHGLEADLIIELAQGILGVEIKFRADVSLHDAKALIAIREKAENWLGGLIVYQGSEIKKLDQDIWAVPSWRLFSPIGTVPLKD